MRANMLKYFNPYNPDSEPKESVSEIDDEKQDKRKKLAKKSALSDRMDGASKGMKIGESLIAQGKIDYS